MSRNLIRALHRMPNINLPIFSFKSIQLPINDKLND